jgi:DNA gyrase subunit A
MRGRASIEERGNKNVIIISEVPYQLNKSSLVEKIAELVQEKIIVGVSDIRDESNKESVRIVIELKRDAFPKKILNQLYKLTPLQTSFAFNMIALHDGGIQPKLFNLLEILLEFIDHRRIVVVRRTRFELAVAEARAHILEGLKIALDNIDAVIKTIKASTTREDAHKNLMKKFGLSDKQSAAILEMQLQRLAGLERKKIEDELAEKLATIADLKDILANPARVDTIIGDEMKEVKEKFGDARRTEVVTGAIGEFNPKDTIPNEEVIVSLSRNNYVKRIKATAFRTQKRGGRGVQVAVKEEDEIRVILSTKNHADLLFFTNTGRVFQLPAYEIPEAQRTAKGQPIVNLFSLAKDEEITTILDVNDTAGKNLVLITRKGVAKRIDGEELANIRSSGLIVMKPREGDTLGWVRSTTGKDNVLLVSRQGKAIQFNEEDVRVMGRTAAGVRGMRLSADESIVEADVVGPEDKYVLTVFENGLGKVTEISEFREQGRGGSGVKVGAITKKTGNVVGSSLLSDEDYKEGEVLLISRSGQTIRLTLKTVRITSRVTQGVILTKLAKGDAIVSATVMKKGVEEEEGEEQEDDEIDE